MYSNYEKIDFLIIGGAVLMNLYLDHAAKLNLFMSNHDFYEKKVIVSYILPNSKLNILNNIVAGTIIKEINNKKINNLNDVRNAISKPLKIKNNKILKLKNDDGNVIFLNMDEIIKENKILSKLYHFNLKNIIH